MTFLPTSASTSHTERVLAKWIKKMHPWSKKWRDWRNLIGNILSSKISDLRRFTPEWYRKRQRFCTDFIRRANKPVFLKQNITIISNYIYRAETSLVENEFSKIVMLKFQSFEDWRRKVTLIPYKKAYTCLVTVDTNCAIGPIWLKLHYLMGKSLHYLMSVHISKNQPA